MRGKNGFATHGPLDDPFLVQWDAYFDRLARRVKERGGSGAGPGSEPDHIEEHLRSVFGGVP